MWSDPRVCRGASRSPQYPASSLPPVLTVHEQLIPTVLLALLKSADTGQNFWIILIMALAVFLVVQLICDMIVTPKVMGKAMGLNPAILLLSLSVWGALLGFIGLIIALPLTTLLIAYYQRYVTKEGDAKEQEGEQTD